MISVREYWNKISRNKVKADEWVPWLKDMTIIEFNTPSFVPIKVAGKEHPQDLISTLKRTHGKAIGTINRHIHSIQKREAATDITAGKKGQYWAKARYKTIPLQEDLDYLKLLDKLFEHSEVWDITKDEYNMSILKKLKWRHPYAKDLRGMLVLAHLKTTNNLRLV